MEKLIVIIEGPSGVGKDTIINELINRYPNKFGRPINANTRAMRENESQGNPYLFMSEEEFRRLRNTGEIFEETIRHGSYRGMRKSSFDEILNSGKIALRDVDRFGLEAVRSVYGHDNVIGIFLTAPKEEIKKRMIERNEPIESMNARLKDFDTFIEDAKYYDYTIENLDIDKTIENILNIIEMNIN
jgi:guanylate kinase